MLRSEDRILTTHVGSLPRPADLLDMMKVRLSGAAFDVPACDERVRRAVGECVRRQMDNGIDIVADGEMSKPGFFAYVKERLCGRNIWRLSKQASCFRSTSRSSPTSLSSPA